MHHDCPAETRYRIRVYETTSTLERFNNVAPQVTVVVLNNPAERPIDAIVWFWNRVGEPRRLQRLHHPAQGNPRLNTIQSPPTRRTR